jgi:hypothetical protein
MMRDLRSRFLFAFAAAVLFHAGGWAQTAPPASSAATGAPASAWYVDSPYASLQRTTQLLDTIGFEVLSGYLSVRESTPALAVFPGARASRRFSKRDGDQVSTVELIAAAHPSGAYRIYLRGGRIREGVEGPNPDLPDIHARVTALLQTLGPASGPGANRDAPRLAYEIFQLSYVEADRAMATLKALDYSTVEFEENSAETIYDRVFIPKKSEQVRLPVVVKLIAASKTSLQESTADSGAYSGSREGLPDLGGIFLHRTTAAEPQNRLLIAYDPEDLESLERIVNLLTDVIDVPARQIVVEALVIEIQGDSTRDLGVSFGVTGKSFDVQVAEEQRLVPTPLTFLFNRTVDALTFKARLHALLETSRAKVLSNPSVLVLDGRQAKIQIGNRIPVVETTVTSSSATESVLYFPVGIVLNLRPRVSKDGSEISMQVETIVSAARQTLASTGSSTRAPEVESRQVQTIVRVHNDTPFIIGGLTTNDEISSRRGIPILSSIPGLGAIFSRTIRESVKKEIIIVVTPRLVPEDPKTFSFVIPQSSPIFDAFGRQLLYNAYRVRRQDVFDLDFLYESRGYRSLVDCAQRAVAGTEPRQVPVELRALLNGAVPGEEILVRRMLWEIVRRTDYARFVDPGRVIFFEKVQRQSGGTDFEVAFFGPKLEAMRQGPNALALTFDARAQGTPEHPFEQPTAAVSYESVTPDGYGERLARGNARAASGEPESWSIVLSDAYKGTASPLEILRGVIVLKSILALNPNLPLTVREFSPGRQIVFPTETELTQSWHLIDPEAARLFYEVMNYYGAFEEEFKHRAKRLVPMMGGCEWWEPASPAPAPPGGQSVP